MADEPIRVLHFADLHIGMENYGQVDPATGVNQRVLDFVLRLKEIVDYALAHEADLVVFAGDAFKTRDPNPTYLREFGRHVMRLAHAGVPVVLVAGNHDMPLMERRANSVDIFRTLEVPGIVVGNREALHTLQTRRGPVQVGVAPWPQRARMMAADEQYRRMNIEDLDRELERLVASELERLAGEVDPAIPAMLCGHFSVNGATYGSERSVMIGRDAVISKSALANPAWDYVALGHIHKYQDLNAGSYPSIVYSGSLERIDFGEANDAKGFVWVELARGRTVWQFIPLTVRPFVSIDVDATRDADTPTDAALREIARHDVTDAIVRVRVKLLQEQEPLFRVKDVERALAGAHYIAAIARDVQREARARIGLANPEALAPIDLVRAYFLSRNTPEGRLDDLLGMARSVMDVSPPRLE